MSIYLILHTSYGTFLPWQSKWYGCRKRFYWSTFNKLWVPLETNESRLWNHVTNYESKAIQSLSTSCFKLWTSFLQEGQQSFRFDRISASIKYGDGLHNFNRFGYFYKKSQFPPLWSQLRQLAHNFRVQAKGFLTSKIGHWLLSSSLSLSQ
jgi:hypothetical protein